MKIRVLIAVTLILVLGGLALPRLEATMPTKRFYIITLLFVVSILTVAGCTSEPTSISGVITEPLQLAIGDKFPDIPIMTAQGENTSFSNIVEPVTIFAFVKSQGKQCCWLHPEIVSLAMELAPEHIAVAQISIPDDACPHGDGCVATCNLDDPRLISLCDAKGIAWEAFGKPTYDTVVLVNYRGRIEQILPLTALETVIPIARQLAQEAEGGWSTPSVHAVGQR